MNKVVKGILYSIATISFVVCIVIGVRRIEAERRNETIQIGIKYEDVLQIAYYTNKDIGEVLAQMKMSGANTLFVKENTVMPLEPGALNNYAAQGHIDLLKGYQIVSGFDYEGEIKAPFTYIITGSTEIADKIYGHLEVKGVPVSRFKVYDEEFIEVREEKSLTTIGVGFPYKDLEVATALGYTICPQLREWPSITDESIVYVTKGLKELSHLGPVYFLGDTLSGYNRVELIDFVAEQGMGFQEFLSHKQKGFGSLAKAASKTNNKFNVVRQFGDDNLETFSTLDTLSRYELALHERGIRAFLFVLPKEATIEDANNELQQTLWAFKQRAESRGYTTSGIIEPYNLRPISHQATFVAGLGTIILFILLMKHMGTPKIGLGLGVSGIIVYGIVLAISPMTAARLMALFAAVICPSYGIIRCMDLKERNNKETLLAFFKVCAISLAGALTIVGVLSRTSYALGIDLFLGVKAAYLFPIVFVVMVKVYSRQRKDKTYIKTILTHKVTYLTLGILGIFTLFFFIYALRLGNTSKVPYLEKVVRDGLTQLLGVRPRTKEFLIGYPLLILLLRFGYKDKYLPVLAVATIGPISLVNTYAHIHTPLIISLVRSGYGILLGILIGFIEIYIVQFIFKIMEKQKRPF